VDEAETLIRRAQEGNSDAWDALVDRYMDILHRIIHRFGVQRLEETEDIAQDVWLRVYKGLRSFHSDSKFETWLFTIARNCFRDHVHRAWRMSLVSHDTRSDDEEEGSRKEPQDESLESAVERIVISKNQVEAAMEQLPSEYRALLRLRHIAGYSLAEIAQMTGRTSPQAVNNLLRRAETRLREAVASCDAEVLSKGK